jgi:putative membrane protein
MMWGYAGMPGWGNVIMMVGTGLFWLAIIAIAAAAALRLPRREARPDPQRVLAERFALGEIDEREYRHGLDVLADPARSAR